MNVRYYQATRKDGRAESLPAYTIDDFPYDQLHKGVVFDDTKRKPRFYSEDFATFDIESTTYYDAPNDRYRGFMYIWQMTVHDIDCYGRTWEEWINFVNKLRDCVDGTLVIYVHNLAFEYEFMFRILEMEYGKLDIFAVKSRKPLVVRVAGLEFRCSYKLSNMSLYKATQTEYGCQYVKSIGDLDYKKYRSPITKIDDTEFGYAMMDTKSLYHYIKYKMRNDGDTLATIPLTSTGYVRRECREICSKDPNHMQIVGRNTMTPLVYTLLKEAGRGGDTSSNFRMTGIEISDVDSFDVKSSYPYVMLTKKYPMRKFYPYGQIKDKYAMDDLCADKPVLMRAAFKGLKMRPETVDIYLSSSKKIDYTGKVREANGRVMYAEAISFTLTDIDWKILRKSYTFDSVELFDVHVSRYDYLPKALRSCVLKFFVEKCELEAKRDSYPEGSEEYEYYDYLYAKSKNRLNGIFGMCYTDPVHDQYMTDYEDTGDWTIEEADIKDSLKKLGRYSNNFLVYAWGVWTTAHARHHLNRLTDITGEFTIYWDTDSSKVPHDGEVHEAIARANEYIRNECKARGAYCVVNGETYYLGTYEHEGTYKTFKTLGAKKYAYVDQKDRLHVIISGVARHHEQELPDGAREMKTISNFKRGYTFKEAGGITLYYNDDKVHVLTARDDPDYRFTCGANIGTKDSTYEIGVTKEYAEVIGIDICDDDML